MQGAASFEKESHLEKDTKLLRFRNTTQKTPLFYNKILQAENVYNSHDFSILTKEEDLLYI